MKRFIKDMRRYLPYTKYATKSGLKSEVASSHLSWLWWILDPILFMLVYWFIFMVIFGQKKEYFHIFVFVGLSMWNLFNKTVYGSVRIVAANRAVVTKVYIPKYYLILILLCQNLFKMAISFGIVIVMMLWSHVPVSGNVIYVIPILADLILVTFGVSTIFAHFGVFFDDLKNLTNVGLRVLFYMSGIFYVISDRVDKAIATLLLKVNPIGFLIDACRESLIYSNTPHRRLILLWFVIGSVLSAVGIVTIYKNENNYVKVI
jgi:teichoic acid transport system permease protein